MSDSIEARDVMNERINKRHLARGVKLPRRLRRVCRSEVEGVVGMKIPSCLREEAAVYCSAMAAWWVSSPHAVHPLLCIEKCESYWLAYKAFAKADEAFDDALTEGVLVNLRDATAESWAEAEALLRTGWEP
jgi:hypothetical protein